MVFNPFTWRAYILGGLCLLILFAVSACSSSPAGKITIAVLLPPASQENTLLKAGMEAGARKAGVRLQFGPEAANLAEEHRFLASLNSHPIAAVILTPASPDESASTLKETRQAGIHVLCYRSCLNVEGVAEAFLPDAQREAGRLAGDQALDYIVSLLGGQGTVGILSCPGEACVARQVGFTERLKLLPGVELITSSSPYSSGSQTKAVEDLLRDHPQIDVIWAANANLTRLALPAVQKRGKAVLIGSEMNQDILNLLNAQTPRLGGVAFALEYQAGFALVETAVALQQGLDLPDYAGALAAYATPADDSLAKDFVSTVGKFILPFTAYQPRVGQPTQECNCVPRAHPGIPTPP